jgi:hypothetical protein
MLNTEQRQSNAVLVIYFLINFALQCVLYVGLALIIGRTYGDSYMVFTLKHGWGWYWWYMIFHASITGGLFLVFSPPKK